MHGLIKAAALTVLAVGGLAFAGCQDQSPSRSSAPIAPESANPPAGVADNNGTGVVSPQPAGTGPQQIGNAAHSGTLGGGTAHDPNANTPGGGN